MYKETRKYLMDHFELEKVIKVGEGEFFKNTGVRTAVLFFKNTGETTKNVEFVQVNKVGNKIDEVSLMNVSIEKIVENNYSLNINMYKEVVFNNVTNFETVILKNITSKVNFKSCNHSENGNIKYFTCSNKVKRTDTISLEKGYYLIIGSRGSTISDSIHYIYNDVCGLGNNMFVFKFENNKNLKFIYYYLVHNKEIINNCITGSTIPMINRDSIEQIKFPLPPLEIQERIVEQLDNIYENEIENSKKTIEGLEKSIESIMKNTLMRKDLEDYKMNSISTIKRGNLVSQSDNKDENLYPYYAGSKISGYAPSYEFENESIMMNYRLSLGAKTPCAYIKEGQYNCSRFSWVLQNKSNINFKYLYYYLNSNVNYDDLLVGSTILEINSTTLKAFKVYLPPLEIQEQIVTECNSKETIINLLKDNITQAEKQANEIMDNLFK